MSLESLLDHVCDVYRLESTSEDSSFMNIPNQHNQKQLTYSKEPVIQSEPCHFEEQNQNVVQGDPMNQLNQMMRITFLPDADIQLNDAVEWEGDRYILQKPKSVRGHHQIVIGIRSEKL